MAPKPKAFWPLTITAGVNNYIDLAVEGGAEMNAQIAAGVYLSLAALLTACETAVAAKVDDAVVLGDDWKEVNNIPNGNLLGGMTTVGDRIVAVGAGELVVVSDDVGVSWRQTSFTTSGDFASYLAVTSIGSRVVAVGATQSGAAVVAVSDDGGESWTRKTSGITAATKTLRGIAVVGTRLVAVGDPTSNKPSVITSDDNGETWTERHSGVSETLYQGFKRVVTKGTRLVAIATHFVYTSDDSGATWTQRVSTGGSPALTGLVTHGARLVLVGTGGTARYSTDNGVTWTDRTSGVTDDLWNVASVGGKLVAVGNAVVIVSGDDGVNWSTRAVGVVGTCNVFAPADGMIVIDQNADVFVSYGGTGSVSAVSSADGHVTIRSPVWSVSLLFSTGTNAAESARDVLGFGAVDVAAGVEATYQHQNGWYADRAVEADSKPHFKRLTAQTVAQSGAVKDVDFPEQELRTIALGMLPPYKTKVDCEGVRLNEAIERLWRDGSSTFRWWPDASVEATFADYRLDEADRKAFNPKRYSPTKEAYSIGWQFRKVV